ncbi:hypothetical protein BDF22DRAFT_682415 [Syncephalis plumigaleata]|nr:hypothetical protein BDF22DRAFT_682415 [Syncephalis plumigaleata]
MNMPLQWSHPNNVMMPMTGFNQHPMEQQQQQPWFQDPSMNMPLQWTHPNNAMMPMTGFNQHPMGQQQQPWFQHPNMNMPPPSWNHAGSVIMPMSNVNHHPMEQQPQQQWLQHPNMNMVSPLWDHTSNAAMSMSNMNQNPAGQSWQPWTPLTSVNLSPPWGNPGNDIMPMPISSDISIDQQLQQWLQQLDPDSSSSWNPASSVGTPSSSSTISGKPARVKNVKSFASYPQLRMTATYKKDDILLQFPKRHGLAPISWKKSRIDWEGYRTTTNWKGTKCMIVCYKEPGYYDNEREIHKYIEEKRKGLALTRELLDSIMLEVMASAQTSDKKIGCFIYEQSKEYVRFKSYIYNKITAHKIRSLPNIISQVITAVSLFNSVGIIYNEANMANIYVSYKNKGVPTIKFAGFGRAAIDVSGMASASDTSNSSGARKPKTRATAKSKAKAKAKAKAAREPNNNDVLTIRSLIDVVLNSNEVKANWDASLKQITSPAAKSLVKKQFKAMQELSALIEKKKITDINGIMADKRFRTISVSPIEQDTKSVG